MRSVKINFICIFCLLLIAPILHAGIDPFYKGHEGMSAAQVKELYDTEPVSQGYNEKARKAVLYYKLERYGVPMEVCYLFHNDQLCEVKLEFNVSKASEKQVRQLMHAFENDIKAQMPDLETAHHEPRIYKNKTYYIFSWHNQDLLVDLFMEFSHGSNWLYGSMLFRELNY